MSWLTELRSLVLLRKTNLLNELAAAVMVDRCVYTIVNKLGSVRTLHTVFLGVSNPWKTCTFFQVIEVINQLFLHTYMYITCGNI